MSTDFCTIGELTERFGCTPITLRRWIAKGIFPPPVRLGRKVFWLRENIAKFEQFAAEVAAKKAANDLQFLVPPLEATT